MFLKVLTTTFVVFGLALLFAMPTLLGERPPNTDQIELARYGTRMLAYFGVTSLTWIGAATCAVILMRRMRRQFIDEQRKNLTEMIEGALRDHERQK